MTAVRWGVRLIAFYLLLHSLAFAQVTTADIVGRVTDSTGAVLPGATVTITNEGTRDVRTAPTTESGDYAFNLLPIGTYAVKVELQGFGTQNTRLVLSAGDRARFDAKLSLGQVAENITVTATVSALQTDTSTVGSLINLKEVQDLPVNGRNFIRLIQGLPGANEGLPNSLASGTRPDDRRQTSAISINGAADNQNNQLIDGMDNNERAIGTIGVKPSIDAIAEIKVQTSNYTAEAGRTAGGVVNIITKSGTNSFSGSAFEFYRNDRFDARNFFSATKPLLKQHQFGGSLGGPLRTDRMFFFGDYEGFSQDQGVTNLVTLPTSRMRAGDFSELSVPIYDPLTTPRTPFPGNQIPANRLNPIALKYMALLPANTNGSLANNYASTTLRTQDSATADARIDYRFNNNQSIFVRYSFNNVDTFTPSACDATAEGIQPGCGGGPAFPGQNNTKAHGTQVNYVRIFSPTMIAEVKGGYLKADIQSLPLNYGSNLSQTFGIPGVNFDAVTSGLALMTLTGYSALGDSTFIPLIQVDDTWQTNAIVTKIFGEHNVRMGAGYIARQFTVFQSASPVGNFTFNTQLTDNGAGSGGNAIASFLLGYPSQVARSHSLIYPHYHTNEPNFFVQDDWRATSWLTLNLGVRYDVFTPLTEESNQLANFDPATGKILVAGQNGVSDSANVKTDYSNIAPRLGFSATLPSSIVVRGGYGLAYFPGNMQSGAFMKNAPFVACVRAGDQQRHHRHPAVGIPVERSADAGGHRSGEPERRRHRRRSELQVHARAAVQPDRGKGVRRQRAQRRVCRLSRRPRAPERRRGRCGHQPGAGWAWGRGRTPCVRDARAGSHEYQHAEHAVRNVVQRDAAGVPAPLSRRLLDQLELHAGAQRVDGVGAVECRGHRALRRRQRRAPQGRIPRQLRAAVGTIDDWRREALRGGMAGECRRRVADGRPVQHHQRCGAREHRRRRSAESRRQSRARESDDHPLLRHDGVPGRSRSTPSAIRSWRATCSTVRRRSVSTCRCSRTCRSAAPHGCSSAWRSTT